MLKFIDLWTGVPSSYKDLTSFLVSIKLFTNGFDVVIDIIVWSIDPSFCLFGDWERLTEELEKAELGIISDLIF